MRYLTAFSLFLLLCGCTAETTDSAPAAGAGTATESSPLETALKDVEAGSAQLLDVRTAAEWDAGHFKDAIHIPVADVESQAAEKLDKTKTIYTHCAKGARATTAAETLKEMGFKVEPLKTTYDAIKEAGFKEAAK